ncbi:hypothetical protein F5I97DRAFT_706883 [Phlebopus sp. FC_14]|nr:hypothetical protein F5I97DRAFT_706883 [Phlebopus sp. FC_14]
MCKICHFKFYTIRMPLLKTPFCPSSASFILRISGLSGDAPSGFRPPSRDGGFEAVSRSLRHIGGRSGDIQTTRRMSRTSLFQVNFNSSALYSASIFMSMSAFHRVGHVQHKKSRTCIWILIPCVHLPEGTHDPSRLDTWARVSPGADTDRRWVPVGFLSSARRHAAIVPSSFENMVITCRKHTAHKGHQVREKSLTAVV